VKEPIPYFSRDELVKIFEEASWGPVDGDPND
jgi:hypothetical protein